MAHRRTFFPIFFINPTKDHVQKSLAFNHCPLGMFYLIDYLPTLSNFLSFFYSHLHPDELIFRNIQSAHLSCRLRFQPVFVV